MKKYLLLSLLIISCQLIKAQKRMTGFQSGTIVTNKGDSIKCLIERAYYYSRDVPYKLVENGKVVSMPIKEIKSVMFPYKYMETIELDKKLFLMDLIADGKLQLLSYLESHHGLLNGSIVIKDETGGYIYKNWHYCIKKDGRNIEIEEKGAEKILKVIFSDCKSVMGSIGAKGYAYYHLELLVKAYNNCFESNNAETDLKTVKNITDSMYLQTDVMPQFKGGDTAYALLLEDNFEFKNPELSPYFDFTVTYQVLIGKTGAVTILKKLDGDFYNEDNLKSIIVKNTNKWIPATDEGKNVSAILNLTIFIRLDSINARIWSSESANTEYQKGKLKEGLKTGIWEYYDKPGALSLKINYENSHLLYIQKDTSDYVINENGKWVISKLDMQPRYIGSIREFYKIFTANFYYPVEARKKKLTGQTYLEFEVDTLGNAVNLNVINNIDKKISDEIVRVFNLIPNLWLTASKDKQTYTAKFILPILLKIEIDGEQVTSKHRTNMVIPELPLAKNLEELVINLKGKDSDLGTIYFDGK